MTTVYTDPRALARATRERTARLRASLGQVAIEQAQAGMAVSRGLTHGPERSPSTPSPVRPIRPIGRRTKRLFQGWRVRRLATGQAGTRAAVLYNRAPHHAYVLRPGGTARMSDRGYWQAHRIASAPSRRRIAQKILQRALRG